MITEETLSKTREIRSYLKSIFDTINLDLKVKISISKIRQVRNDYYEICIRQDINRKCKIIIGNINDEINFDLKSEFFNREVKTIDDFIDEFEKYLNILNTEISYTLPIEYVEKYLLIINQNNFDTFVDISIHNNNNYINKTKDIITRYCSDWVLTKYNHLINASNFNIL